MEDINIDVILKEIIPEENLAVFPHSVFTDAVRNIVEKDDKEAVHSLIVQTVKNIHRSFQRKDEMPDEADLTKEIKKISLNPSSDVFVATKRVLPLTDVIALDSESESSNASSIQKTRKKASTTRAKRGSKKKIQDFFE